MSNVEINKIQEYLEKLQLTIDENFMDECSMIKSRILSRLTFNIMNDIKQVYNVNSIKIEKIEELISSSLDNIIHNYKEELKKNFEKESSDNKTGDISKEKFVDDNINTMITNINSYIKFKESLASLQYGRSFNSSVNIKQIRKIEELEFSIKHYIKKYTYEFQDIVKDICEEKISDYNKKQKEFLINISDYKKQESQQQNDFDNSTNELSTDGIFEDYESENAKRFL